MNIFSVLKVEFIGKRQYLSTVVAVGKEAISATTEPVTNRGYKSSLKLTKQLVNFA